MFRTESNFLKTEECQRIMQDSKILIHVKGGENVFDNKNSQESIYDLMLAQLNYNKLLLKFNLTFSGDCKSYFLYYLSAIKSIRNGKYNMLSTDL